MASVSRYAAVVTKMRSLSAKLLTLEDYEKLLQASDYETVQKYFKQSESYRLEIMNDSTAAESERALKRIMFRRQARLLPFLSDEDLNFVKLMLRRSEIDALKQIMRAIHSGKQLISFDFEPQSYFEIKDFDDLLTAESLDQCIKKLLPTTYGKVLKAYIGSDDEEILFYLETTIDRFYFKELLALAQNLNPEDKKIMVEILGINIDLLNLQWLYRGKNFYQIKPEGLFNYVLEGGSKISLSDLKELCYIESPATLLKEMPSVYRQNFETGELLIESNMERMLYQSFTKKIGINSMNLSAIIFYMHKLEYEMRDIFTILESKRYGLAANDVNKFLVRYEVSLK